MNKHQVLFLVTLLTVGACKGPTQLAVRAVSSGPEGKIVGRPQLVIRLLPYNRDSIFSLLAGRASRPEPQAPADLVELRDSIAVAQSRWRDAEYTVMVSAKLTSQSTVFSTCEVPPPVTSTPDSSATLLPRVKERP